MLFAMTKYQQFNGVASCVLLTRTGQAHESEIGFDIINSEVPIPKDTRCHWQDLTQVVFLFVNVNISYVFLV